MRRIAIPVALVAAIVLTLLIAGAVLAHQRLPGGTDSDDTLTGTPNDDMWEGSPGDDTIKGEGGDDRIGPSPNLAADFGETSDPDADTYYGGPGKDILDGRGDDAVDTMDCGAGGED